jgi:hypothetical protein
VRKKGDKGDKGMKKWIWLVLLVLVTIVTLVSANGFIRQDEQQVIHSARIEKSFTAEQDTATLDKREEDSDIEDKKEIASAPQVSSDKLFAHILRLNFTRHTLAERSRTRAYVTRELKKLGWKSKLEKFTDGVNVFAERQGTNKEAGAILVAAHYDTVFASPGADDNATGVAVALEVARLFGSRATPKTLQLALFDKEEAGLLGSKAFVSNKAHLENLDGVIVMDMVGYACHTAGCQKYPSGLPIAPPSDKGDFLAVVGDTEHLPLLKAFQNSQIPPGESNLPPVLTLPVPFKGLLTPDTLRSDHAPFWYQGIGAVLVTDTANLRTPHYHQPSDVPATIDRKFFTGAAQVVVNAVNLLLESAGDLGSEQ